MRKKYMMILYMLFSPFNNNTQFKRVRSGGSVFMKKNRIKSRDWESHTHKLVERVHDDQFDDVILANRHVGITSNQGHRPQKLPNMTSKNVEGGMINFNRGMRAESKKNQKKDDENIKFVF
jgi:hypothetical protein